ncbi:DUF1273 domain-containing protein [Bacillus tuaregi]|uniref:DUF1273 domain-containing protein n=1 Tax=Bacillus tuaregi TaxID=1816695 RepID=UPI0008F8ECB2|nr:DUF1273 domain-containing protein [Bacillus tuaregi]
MAKVAAISGYKSFELGILKKNHPAIPYIKKAIRNSLQGMLEEGLEWVLISGQLGTELWAAEVVFELRETEYPELKLAVITPYLEQEAAWSETNKEWYESILMEADFVDSVSHRPYEKPWQLRMKNQFHIEKSDILLLFYDSEKEGSPKYLYEIAKHYQENNEYEIRTIQFYDLQVLAEEEQWNYDHFS